jgi:hypothetical protein
MVSDPALINIPMDNIVQIKTKKPDIVASAVAIIDAGAAAVGLYYFVQAVAISQLDIPDYK